MQGAEERLAAIEQALNEIKSFILYGKIPNPGVPGMAEYAKAMDAWLDGDRSLLDEYLDRGGKIPSNQAFKESGYVQDVPEQPRASRRPVQALRGRGKSSKELRQG